jgi:hypothetical protein
VPEDLLDRVLSEIRERLERSRAAYEESQLLERALAALGPGASARAVARAASTRRPGPRRRRAAADGVGDGASVEPASETAKPTGDASA